MLKKYIYPAVFTPNELGGYCIRFPDLPECYTQGEDLTDSMEMAEDALAFAMYEREEKNDSIPIATPVEKIKLEAGEIVTLILANTFEYRKIYNNKAVKKTLSIPEWMNEAAVNAGINFSQTLQDAIKQKLNIA